MEPSRDDFIIAIRSAFLKKGTKQRFSLIALITFSIFLIFLTRINLPAVNYLQSFLNETVYRISFIVSIPEQKFKKTFLLINDHMKLYNDYKLTKEKIKELEFENYNSQFLISENERLKKLIEEYIYNSDELIAKVLIDKDSLFFKSVIVNKGSRDNVELGTAVLDGNYLIGKIVEVNYGTSRALLISDLNSKIPVTIEPGNIQSILTGTGKKHGNIQYKMEEKVINNKKSIVYTSGSGGIFKAGIPIGIIEETEIDNSNIVEFFSDLSQLTFVKLVNFEGGIN